MSNAAHQRTVIPVSDARELCQVADALVDGASCVVGADASAQPLPIELVDVLIAASRALARGDAVVVSPVSTVLTTQEVADLLSVSRPTVVKLLESGRIPFTQPGRHRRVLLSDVLAFQEAESRARVKAMEELASLPDPDPTGAIGFIRTRLS